MEIRTINDKLLAELRKQVMENSMVRQNYDLRTTQKDTSQRMSVLEPRTKVAIQWHMVTIETEVCPKGCLNGIIYTELPNVDCSGTIHDGEVAADEESKDGMYRE